MSAFVSFFESMLRVSAPLLFAALGGLMSERSGVINIALEGKMMVGAFAGAAVALAVGSPYAGAAAGALAGLLLALVYGLFVIRFKANQIVAGTAINLLAAGIPPVLSKVLYDSTGSTPGLDLASRFTIEPIYAVWGIALLLAAWFRFSRSGLWLQFAGEKPDALNAAGVGVNALRWWGVSWAGILAGLGGMSLSICLSSQYVRNITAGRGFMALAALILGKWKPLPTVLACLLLGAADAAQIRLQGVVLWGESPVPVQFIQIMPYLLTVFVLAGVVGESRAPKALGIPYEKSSG